MDERNSSRSSSSTTAQIVSEISDAQIVADQEKGEAVTCLEQQDSLQTKVSHIYSYTFLNKLPAFKKSLYEYM